jgi:hypothetical protein
MMVRTILRSDAASYPWLAPAGTRRGVIDNAAAIGYIDAATGEFNQIGVSQSQCVISCMSATSTQSRSFQELVLPTLVTRLVPQLPQHWIASTLHDWLHSCVDA